MLVTTKYSKELINSIILCFKEENNHVSDRETAITCLDSFADLYLAFAMPSVGKCPENVDIKR